MYKYCLINQTSSKTKFEKREKTDLIYLSINTGRTTILTQYSKALERGDAPNRLTLTAPVIPEK